MSSNLSNSTIQKLTPLLESLAHLVASDSKLSDPELNVLLLGEAHAKEAGGLGLGHSILDGLNYSET
jgi:hypothetical protein